MFIIIVKCSAIHLFVSSMKIYVQYVHHVLMHESVKISMDKGMSVEIRMYKKIYMHALHT